MKNNCIIQRSDSLKCQAYTQIRSKILHQELAFGQKLNIADLAREFGISNSPIREALSQLENEGLVDNVPSIGFHVVQINEENFRRLSQAIQVLLSGCYDDIVLRGSERRLAAQLSDCLEKQKSLYDGRADYDYACVAIAFDRAFVEQCQNPLLNGMFSNKFDLLALCTLQFYRNNAQFVLQTLQEHEAIYQAVKTGDHQLVRKLLFDHYNENSFSVFGSGETEKT